MILGIASFSCACFPFGIAAFVMGLVSRSRIDKAPGQHSGRAFATAGIILGAIGTVFSILYLGYIGYMEFGGGNERVGVWFENWFDSLG